MDFKKYNNDKLYPGFKNLKNHFPFFIDQISRDNEITETLKYECLDSICSKSLSTKTDIQNECYSFFESKTLIGTLCRNPETKNPFVRVNSKDSLVSWIAQIVGLSVIQVNSTISTILYSPNLTIKNGILSKLLSIEAISDSYLIPENCLKYFGVKVWKSRMKPVLKDAFLTNFKYIQWSFPLPLEDIFFDQASIDLIPCRAGLVVSGDQIIFKHILSKKYNVRKPTVLDARLYPQFEPGGITKPLPNCNHLSGFEEFVHVPNNFSNIDGFEAQTFYTI